MVRVKEENINTVEFWNGLHAGIHNRSIRVQFERFFQLGFLPTDKSVSVLDVGVGNANHFGDLKEEYPLVKFSGLDFSDACVEKNKGKYPDSNFYCVDIDKEDVPEVFDYIVSMHSFEHFEDPVAALKKCREKCRKRVIILVPYEDAWGKDPTHIHRFTLKDPFTGYVDHKIVNGEKEIFYVFEGLANE